MQQPATDKIVFITGAASGFGMGAALAFARRGYRVMATMRNLAGRTSLQAAAEEQKLQSRLDYLEVDVTVPATIQRAVEETINRYGRIDILVNNAGYALGGAIEEIPLDSWRHQFETNLFGLISVTQAVLPYMRKQRTGTIINISSVSGRIGLPGYAPYASSKFAVEGFSESLRMELLPFGIHVVLIEPGAYNTSIWQKGFNGMEVAADSPYRAMMDTVLAYSRKTAETAADPREVVEAIVKAAETPAPRLRYTMGKGTRLLLAAKALLPWKWLEGLIKRALR
ncbi:SDR family oxidoreductase [Brevibacillus fluminis]|uniref:SDR family oxidoreductase n=1 Tax=Brevibacillus fluminis TaxID=511487 RepID=UPI003F8B0A09